VFLSTQEANPTDQAPGSDSPSTNPEGGTIPTPPYPSRPRYQPGELVDYTAQEGDTLPFLASRFNTSVEAILEANTFIPASATTMPPGMPMKIPIYYLPLWGSPYRIIPDSLFINGPAQVGFDTQDFVNTHPGWLKHYKSYVSDVNRSGAEIVDFVAHYWSVSPRLLLRAVGITLRCAFAAVFAAGQRGLPARFSLLESQRSLPAAGLGCQFTE
jgi:hypothetical protein